MPPQPDGLWRSAVQRQADKWIDSKGEDRLPPRPLYLRAADSAVSEDDDVRRPSRDEVHASAAPAPNTPLQALTTLNDPAFFEAAQAHGAADLTEGGADGSAIASAYAFRLVTSAAAERRRAETDCAAAFGAAASRISRRTIATRHGALAGESDCRSWRPGRWCRERAAEPRRDRDEGVGLT